MSVRDCLESSPRLEVGELVFGGRFRAREAAWCCQVMACGRGKRRGREAIRCVFGTTETRSRGWAFDYVRARPAKSSLSGPCLLKQRPSTPQPLDLKWIVSPMTELTVFIPSISPSPIHGSF